MTRLRIGRTPSLGLLSTESTDRRRSRPEPEILAQQERLSPVVRRRRSGIQGTDPGRQLQAVRTESQRQSIDGPQQVTRRRDDHVPLRSQHSQDRFRVERGVQSQLEQPVPRRHSVATDRGPQQQLRGRLYEIAVQLSTVRL